MSDAGTWISVSTEPRDTARVISGFIATVSVDGDVEYATGDGSWLVYPSNPGVSDWMEVGFDDSSWAGASTCSDASAWGTYWPAPFYNEGAQWIWDDTNCRTLGDAYFRMNFVLP